MANRFINENDLLIIELGDGDWVKVPSQISYGLVEEFGTVEGSKISQSTKILLKLIKEWNLKDGEEVAPINEANLRRLDMKTVTLIMKQIEPLITVDPKA